MEVTDPHSRASEVVVPICTAKLESPRKPNAEPRVVTDTAPLDGKFTTGKTPDGAAPSTDTTEVRVPETAEPVVTVIRKRDPDEPAEILIWRQL